MGQASQASLTVLTQLEQQIRTFNHTCDIPDHAAIVHVSVTNDFLVGHGAGRRQGVVLDCHIVHLCHVF